jgi:VWFA-related protein
MRRYFLHSAWMLVLAQALSAQTAQNNQPASPASPPPSAEGSVPELRVRSEVVLVPVVVLDKHGQHISGLAKDAFRLEENGKEQAIASIEETRPSESKAAQPSAADEGFSNLPLDLAQQPRLTILLLDLFNSSPLQQTDGKEQLIKFLSKDVHGDEPISVVCIANKGVRLLRPPTADRAALIQSLQQLNTGGYTLGGVYPDPVRFILEQIRFIAWAYAGVPGRKSLIWTTGQIPYPPLGEDAAGVSAVVIRAAFDDTRKSLLSANIAVYPFGLLPRDPTFDTRYKAEPTMEGLRYFADATGGGVCLESNDLSGCLKQAVEDSRSYYMLSYSVKPDDRKPGWRDLKVKVTGVQASVRARSGFYYQDRTVPSSPADNHQDEIAALASPLSASAVQMNVRVLDPATPGPPVAPGAKATIQFLITVPLSAINVDSSRADAVDLEVGTIALTKDVKEAGEFLHPLQGHLKPEAMERLAHQGITFHEKLDLPAGIYDMRFFVRDNSTGQIGTVVFPLEVK